MDLYREHRRGNELDKQIYADPSDERAREVYADLLLDRGDPRGEFIQLQCLARRQPLDAAQTRRMAALQREHAESWYGTLGPVLAGAGFSGGFLSRVRIKSGEDQRAAALASDPLWSTVEELDVSDVFDSRKAAVVAPHLARLRVLQGLRTEALFELLPGRTQPLQLEALGTCLNDHTHEPVGLKALLAATDVLPDLRRLSIGCAPKPGEQGWLLTSALGRQLTALELPYPGWAPNWLHALAEATWLEELALREDADTGGEHYGWYVVFRRGPDGALTRATASFDGRRRVNSLDAPLLRLASALARLDVDALTELTIERGAGMRPKEGRAELDAAVSRQHRLTNPVILA